MKKVRYAIIGFGGIAENRIAKEGFACDKSRFKPLENAELTGAFDVNASRKEAAEALGLKWYDSVESVLADHDVDAVFIATNNLTHAPIAMRALEAGKHCFVEKPIATTVEDAAALCAMAKKKNLSLAVDHMMIGNAYNVKAKKMIADGTLGKVNDICLHMEFLYGTTPEEAATWRCSKVEEVGGPIGDVASHCMYMAEFLMGSEIVELACVYYPKMLPIKAEDGAYIKFKLASGVYGSVRAAFNEGRGGSLGATFTNLGYEVYGDEAVLRSYAAMHQLSGHEDEPVKVRLELDRFNEQCPLGVEKITNIYQNVITHHADSILKNQPMNGIDGLHSMQLVAAAHESAQNNGRVVKIDA